MQDHLQGEAPGNALQTRYPFGRRATSRQEPAAHDLPPAEGEHREPRQHGPEEPDNEEGLEAGTSQVKGGAADEARCRGDSGLDRYQVEAVQQLKHAMRGADARQEQDTGAIRSEENTSELPSLKT